MAVKHDYAPNMRRALYEGLMKAAKEKKLTLTEYCQLWWEEDWKAAINAMAKFAPKENKVTGKVQHEHEHHHTHAGVDDTAKFIDSILGMEERDGEIKH